ncbi:hypothetical protein CspHIS471_0204240 [Cutaneotrichosporon sp. HIS471]|nr:hypothetical protein CspHIS471_0204240 [Cutaneotrichosporon sp. HIS471]
MQSSGVGAPPGGPPPPGPPGGSGIPRASTADDGDNRSRNAKAQRRHREKRKAHFKALEEQVQILTAQLEDARRQVAAAQYASNARLAYSPDDKGMQQLVSENAYLREENADLRRQVYSLRVSYGGARDPGSAGPLPPPPADQPKTTTGIWPEVKTEAAPYGVYSAPGSAVVSSPRLPGSSHARTQSHPGEFVRLTWQDPAAEPSSASSSYPPPLYQFGSVVSDDFRGPDPARHQPQRGSSSTSSRGRLMSSSSAPSASPYVTSAPFPTDPRAHALGGTPTQPYLVRYESAVYPPAAPPPHSLPRSAVGSGSSGSYAYATTPVQAYVPRAEGEVAWGQDVSWAAPVTGPQP